MVLPREFPPPEIITAIELELGLPFQHFKVSMDGEIEGIFGIGENQEIVSFEVSRSITDVKIPSLTSIIGELDDIAIEEMKKMFLSMLAEIEVMTKNQEDVINFSISDTISYSPRFSDDWYCP